jgi:uncharacterized membrane protein YfhO
MATVRSFQADRISIETLASHKSILVVSEQADSGWLVTIDGRPAQWYRVDYQLRGVPLPSGSHRIEFIYRPASIKKGAAISLISALVMMAIFGLTVSNRPRLRGGAA